LWRADCFGLLPDMAEGRFNDINVDTSVPEKYGWEGKWIELVKKG